MAKGQRNSVIRSLRRVALLRSDADVTDGELLEGYLSQREEASFEALLHRHGPMVLGVCRRILQNEADAQDAFQATFLVFLRKAATIVPRALVGNWLHGVAYKTALKAQAMNRQRKAKEREARANVRPAAAPQALQDRLEVLDEALSRLPAKYRSAIVLCDLEGKTIKEAARQLNCPPGTVASRLASGRALLARRLTRYGLCLTAGTVAQGLAQGAVPPGIPQPLIAAIVKAASLLAADQDAAKVLSAKVVALSERVVKAMLIAKLKTLTTVLLAMMVLGGAGVLCSYPTFRAQQGQAPAQAAFPFVLAATAEEPKSDKELIQGTWIPVAGEQNGEKLAKEKLEGGKMVLMEGKLTLQVMESWPAREGTYTIDPDKKPKEIDMTFGNATMMGLYELKGTTLKVVMAERGRPSDFDSAGATLITFERKK
jgi:RNA polymerase sigma factor (sigma-70 family)